ncbi:hypothetical protein KQX54_020141 [Cotesia glomerata]|uniref:Uncharacterized protein n=1 Tax=Cotesia glomerata TaxID=32391 RepID=A0AAV7IE80_COTGL|nr:hypothetical protein KQX54_020141 [Cotesia glomerata]
MYNESARATRMVTCYSYTGHLFPHTPVRITCVFNCKQRTRVVYVRAVFQLAVYMSIPIPIPGVGLYIYRQPVRVSSHNRGPTCDLHPKIRTHTRSGSGAITNTTRFP